jgi:hypothetical protein
VAGELNFIFTFNRPTEKLDQKKKRTILPVKKPNTKKGPAQPPIIPQDIDPEKIEAFRQTNPNKTKNREFNHWVNWWENHFTTEDYMKFLSLQVIYLI